MTNGEFFINLKRDRAHSAVLDALTALREYSEEVKLYPKEWNVVENLRGDLRDIEESLGKIIKESEDGLTSSDFTQLF